MMKTEAGENLLFSPTQVRIDPEDHMGFDCSLQIFRLNWQTGNVRAETERACSTEPFDLSGFLQFADLVDEYDYSHGSSIFSLFFLFDSPLATLENVSEDDTICKSLTALVKFDEYVTSHGVDSQSLER